MPQYRKAQQCGYKGDLISFQNELYKQLSIPYSLNSQRTFSWHTWQNSNQVENSVAIIMSEKINHFVTINDQSGRGYSDDVIAWDYVGTVGDGIASEFLAVAASSKLDAQYFTKIVNTTLGVRQANALKSISTATKTLSYAKNFGTGMGLLGVGFTFMEGYSDGNMSAGDWTKLGLSGATFIPYIGWAYGLTDLGF